MCLMVIFRCMIFLIKYYLRENIYCYAIVKKSYKFFKNVIQNIQILFENLPRLVDQYFIVFQNI